MKEQNNSEPGKPGKSPVNRRDIPGARQVGGRQIVGVPAATCVFNIRGGNVQVLPNATTAVQYIYGEPAPERRDTLAPYIHDEAERRNYERRIAQSPDVTTLCRTVLTDLFNDVLADFTEPVRLVKSKEFIQALLPLLTFESGKTERNIRHGIRRYVLGETGGEES